MPCIKVLMHLSGEMHCESKAACPRKQHDVSGHGLNPGPLDLDKTALTMKAALKKTLLKKTRDLDEL